MAVAALRDVQDDRRNEGVARNCPMADDSVASSGLSLRSLRSLPRPPQHITGRSNYSQWAPVAKGVMTADSFNRCHPRVRRRPDVEKARRNHARDDKTRLIEDRPPPTYAPDSAGTGDPRLQDGDHDAQEISRPYGLCPFDLLNPRGSGRFGVHQNPANDQFHGDAAGQPPARDDPAPSATRGARRIGMERLWVVSRGEVDDLAFGHDSSFSLDDATRGQFAESHSVGPHAST